MAVEVGIPRSEKINSAWCFRLASTRRFKVFVSDKEIIPFQRYCNVNLGKCKENYFILRGFMAAKITPLGGQGRAGLRLTPTASGWGERGGREIRFYRIPVPEPMPPFERKKSIDSNEELRACFTWKRVISAVHRYFALNREACVLPLCHQ